ATPVRSQPLAARRTGGAAAQVGLPGPGGPSATPAADRDPLTRRRSMMIPAALLLVLALIPTALPASAQPPGVSDKEILIGGSNSFSGPLAFTGEQITKFGVDLYFKVVNDAGGIHGRTIRTI